MFDIITFGSAVRDLFIKSKNFKTLKHKDFITGQGLCFNLGSKIQIDDLFFATGGGGTNAAATFAKQGLKTAYVGKVGKDAGSRVIKEELNKLKVKSFLSEDKNKKTPYSIIFSVPAKERTILVYQGASHELEKKNIPFNKLRAKWFYIAGLSGKSAKVLLPIVNFAKKNNIRVALDPSRAQISMGFKKMKNILSKLDVLKLNQEEAARLVGLPYHKEREIFKRLSAIGGPASGGDKIIVMTKGPRGVVVSDGKNLYRAGIFKEKKHIDRTGAGDAFGAGFTVGLLQSQKSKRPNHPRPTKSQKFTDKNIEYAIRLGSANATSMVEHLGAKAGILTKTQFLREKRWRRLEITKSKI